MKSSWVIHSVLVGVGGFVGSVCRYALGGFAHRLTGFMTFPIGTLVVNVSGCLAIGLLGGLAETRQLIGPHLRLFLFLGIFGGFTTFSTFGYETMVLVRDGDHLRALANVGLHVAAGLSAVWIGLAVSKAW